MKKGTITLTLTEVADLYTLFSFQLDPEALYMAAFTPKDPGDPNAYMEKYTACLANPSIHMRTIKSDDRIVGSIAKFVLDNQAEITYWIDRPYWGRGIATAALHAFLEMEATRPIRARVACDNIGSQKVLEKCGFVKSGKDKGYANARQEEIEEFIYRLSR